ncbi:MAG TPA: hypothetical protein PK022_10915 [Syntrophales bacterium]|nr:hypothetical protein [Syntrophales bacterium]
MSEEFIINSGLMSILLLDRITAIGPYEIRGDATFDGKAVFSLLEALAQLGAFHIRRCHDFSKHAFLIKVGRCLLPDPIPEAGSLNLKGELNGRSDRSFIYRIWAEREGQTVISGEFSFSTVDYEGKFEAVRLKDHYERVFACLTNASGTD